MNVSTTYRDIKQMKYTTTNNDDELTDSDTSQSSDDLFANVEEELERLNLQHIRVLAANSDDEDTLTETCYKRLSSSIKRNKRRPKNPILASAHYRFAQESTSPNQTGLTYVDCLLFDQERRQHKKHVNNSGHDSEEVEVCPPQVILNKQIENDIEDEERNHPDSALGSEAGSSSGGQVDPSVKLTNWIEHANRFHHIQQSSKRSAKKVEYNSPLVQLINFQQIAQHRRGLIKRQLAPTVYEVKKRSLDDDIPTPPMYSSSSSDNFEEYVNEVAF